MEKETIIDKIRQIIPEGRFDVTHICNELNLPTKTDNGFFERNPYISSMLLKLCK